MKGSKMVSASHQKHSLVVAPSAILGETEIVALKDMHVHEGEYEVLEAPSLASPSIENDLALRAFKALHAIPAPRKSIVVFGKGLCRLDDLHHVVSDLRELSQRPSVGRFIPVGILLQNPAVVIGTNEEWILTYLYNYPFGLHQKALVMKLLKYGILPTDVMTVLERLKGSNDVTADGWIWSLK